MNTVPAQLIALMVLIVSIAPQTAVKSTAAGELSLMSPAPEVLETLAPIPAIRTMGVGLATESEVGDEQLEFPVAEEKVTVHTVPFYSQFTDITPVSWRKVGCGIASVAMLIDFYKPGSVSVDSLLQQGIAAGSFLPDAGWTHQGLINLTKQFGLNGRSHTLYEYGMDDAFAILTEVLEEGPVMVSVHYTFDPQNPIPHLVVVNGVEEGRIFYNDPAETMGGGSISVEQFQSAWKKRYIEIRPV